jgi:hypothetical protein
MLYTDNIRAAPAALLQNPNFLTPPELARGMVIIEVMHYDFTGKVKQGAIIVHEIVAHQVRAFFWEAFLLRFPIHSVIPANYFNWIDEFSCAANNSSGHNMRNIEGTLSLLVKLSKHAIGCAFDINPMQNACYILNEASLLPVRTIPSNGTHLPASPGTLYKEHPLVQLMVNFGWAWGGNWTFPKDNQHFQILPEELAKLVTSLGYLI